MKRKCRVPICTNRHPAGYIVCPSCWRATSRELKAEVRRAYRAKDHKALVAAVDAVVAACAARLSPLLPEAC